MEKEDLGVSRSVSFTFYPSPELCHFAVVGQNPGHHELEENLEWSRAPEQQETSVTAAGKEGRNMANSARVSRLPRG